MKIFKFSTPTCCMCRQVSQVFKNAGIEYEEIDCTTDSGSAMAEKYNITGVPAVVTVSEDGLEMGRFPNYKTIIDAMKDGRFKQDIKMPK